MSTHAGSCHCGKIAYTFEGGPITEGMECNCSMCRRKGTILHFVPASTFTLKSSRSDISTYKFNKHVIAHQFCATCGISPFAEAPAPDGTPMVAINLRCVDGVDPRTIKLTFFNGRDI